MEIFIGRVLSSREINKESQKLSPFVENDRKHIDVPIHLKIQQNLEIPFSSCKSKFLETSQFLETKFCLQSYRSSDQRPKNYIKLHNLRTVFVLLSKQEDFLQKILHKIKIIIYKGFIWTRNSLAQREFDIVGVLKFQFLHNKYFVFWIWYLLLLSVVCVWFFSCFHVIFCMCIISTESGPAIRCFGN